MLASASMETASKDGGAWTARPPSLVVCGRDTTLLWTRKLLLQRAGFPVETLIGIDGLECIAFSALILCHTLSDTERRLAIERYRARLGVARILILAGSGRVKSYEDCELFTEHYQPQLFIETVRHLVANPAMKDAY